MVFFYRRIPGLSQPHTPAAVDAVGFSEILRSFKWF